MRIDTGDIRDGLLIGRIVWVCDFRQPDLNKKAIRHVKPTKVAVRSNNELPKNKRVYYSLTHFSPVNKKGKVTARIISPVDNTGSRSRSGDEINVFDNEADCKQYYKNQCAKIISLYEEAINNSVASLKERQQEVIRLKDDL